MEINNLDQKLVNSIVKLLDGCEYWHGAAKVAEKFRDTTLFEDLTLVLETFDYFLAMGHENPKRPYSPMWQIDDKQYPEPFEAISERKFEKWIEGITVFGKSPVLTARIADLLWINKFGDEPYQFAIQAHSSLLQICNELDWRPIYKSCVLQRAFGISKELKNNDLLQKTKSASFALVASSLSSDGGEAGVILSQLELLVENLEDADYFQLRILLEESENKFAGDPFLVSQALSLQLQLFKSEEEQIDKVQRKLVETWYIAGKESVGLVKLNHLQKAIELASKYGLTTLSRGIRVEFEKSANSVDLGLQEIRASVEVPRNDFDSFVDSFFSAPTQLENLRYFASHRPLDGDLAKTKEFALGLMQKFPLQSVVGTTLLKDGLPFFTAIDTEGHLKLSVNRNETMKIVLWGDIAARILERLLPDKSSGVQIIKEFLATNPLITEGDSECFVKCYGYLMDKKFEEVILLGCARIEKILRELASTCHIPVYNLPNGSEYGSYKTLGSLLDLISPLMNIGSVQYFKLLLNDPGSLNSRNEHYHGLRDSATNLEAILVFHAMLHAAAFKVTTESL